MNRLLTLLTIILPVLGGCAAEIQMTQASSGPPTHPVVLPAPAKTETGLALTRAYRSRPAKTEFATFSAGCFWGVEDAFRTAPGVVATMVGFTGGHVKNPSYETVCTNTTGHAESVRVEYDPTKTTYPKLLDLFFSLHDPTLLNQQGPDVGEQYRSAVFYHTPEQKKQIEASIAKLQNDPEYKGEKIVTEVAPVQAFYRAEEYHQQYVEKGGVAYCHPRRKKE